MAEIFKYRFSKYIRAVFPNVDYTLHFFIITNDEINAIFLARYIAKKLQYHHKLKSILNPLKQEFQIVGYLTTKFDNSVTNFKRVFTAKKFKIMWKFLLLIILLYYDVYMYSYFSFCAINISNESFFTLIWLRQQWKLTYRESFISKSSLKTLANLTQKFLYRRAWILFSLSQLRTTISNSMWAIKYSLNIIELSEIFFKPLIADLSMSLMTLISPARLFFIHKDNIAYFKFGMFNYKRFLTLNYNSLSHAAFTVYNKFNVTKARYFNVKQKTSDFLGFKIKCAGRFSRRQRSSSYWFSLGSVPLNTVSAVFYILHIQSR